jgi:hypothetical protein
METRLFAETEIVYVDKLVLSVLLRLLQYERLTKVYCLEAIKKRNKFFQCVLQLKGVHIEEAIFFAGHLKTQDGECVYLAGRRIAGRAALAASQHIVASDPTLKRLNKVYGRNTIRLFIAKRLAQHIEGWTTRALVVNAISERANPVLWLKKPTRFPEETLLEFLPHVTLHFYSAWFEHAFDLLKMVFIDALRFSKQVLSGYASKHSFPKNEKPGVLMLQEETIRAKIILRNQLYWHDMDSKNSPYETYVLRAPSILRSETGVENELSHRGVTLLPFTSLGSAWREMRLEKVFSEIRRDRGSAYLATLSARTASSRFSLAQVGFLLWQSELIGAISKAIGARVFVTKEPYSTYADAIQLCAKRLGIRTVAIQYSNLGNIAPGFISTADNYIIFSDMYRTVLALEGLTPGKFIPNGYLYDGIGIAVQDRAKKHRTSLQNAGARFIICYFDESVQHDRWGMISKEDHLAELHCLASAVLEDLSFGVVVKSQFMKNSPSQLYPNDELIRQAQATGRYLELKEGNHRNDIYPIEAALASDLCIGHKFGATAALEAALAGVRTVILDLYGTKTQWDKIYASANILFDCIEDALKASTQYRDGNQRQQDLGDWTSIRDHFVSRHDGMSIEATRNLIAKWATDLPDEIIS